MDKGSFINSSIGSDFISNEIKISDSDDHSLIQTNNDKVSSFSQNISGQSSMDINIMTIGKQNQNTKLFEKRQKSIIHNLSLMILPQQQKTINSLQGFGISYPENSLQKSQENKSKKRQFKELLNDEQQQKNLYQQQNKKLHKKIKIESQDMLYDQQKTQKLDNKNINHQSQNQNLQKPSQSIDNQSQMLLQYRDQNNNKKNQLKNSREVDYQYKQPQNQQIQNKILDQLQEQNKLNQEQIRLQELLQKLSIISNPAISLKQQQDFMDYIEKKIDQLSLEYNQQMLYLKSIMQSNEMQIFDRFKKIFLSQNFKKFRSVFYSQFFKKNSKLNSNTQTNIGAIKLIYTIFKWSLLCLQFGRFKNQFHQKILQLHPIQSQPQNLKIQNIKKPEENFIDEQLRNLIQNIQTQSFEKTQCELKQENYLQLMYDCVIKEIKSNLNQKDRNIVRKITKIYKDIRGKFSDLYKSLDKDELKMKMKQFI